MPHIPVARRVSSVAPFLALSLAPFAITADAAVAAEDFGQAIQVVRRAAEALGGEEELRRLDSISFMYEGRVTVAHQGPSIDEPEIFNYRMDVQATFSPLKIRAVNALGGAQETAFENVDFIDGEQSASLRDAARLLRASPHAVIRHLLDNPRDAALVSGSSEEDVLDARFHGELIRLHVARKDGLPRRIVRVFDDARHGDSAAVLEFPAYDSRGTWRVPTTLRSVEGKVVVLDAPFARYSLGGVESSSVLPTPKPERAPTEGAAAEASPAAPQPPGDISLGKGITLLRNTGGFDYHSLLVDTPDGAILIEAPGTVDTGKSTQQRARQTATSPLRYIASTHHHSDHTGGVAGAVFDGARVVIAEAEAPFFRDAISAERSFARSNHTPAKEVALETVAPRGERTIMKRVVAIDFGPSGHSDSHLVFHVPEAKVLFQTDMAVFRWDGSVEPARAQTCRLRAAIRERKLDVATIAGGHGRPGTLEDLDKAIAQRKEGC